MSGLNRGGLCTGDALAGAPALEERSVQLLLFRSNEHTHPERLEMTRCLEEKQQLRAVHVRIQDAHAFDLTVL